MLNQGSVLSSLMGGASHSIDALLTIGVDLVESLKSTELPPIADKSLRLRCILTSPEALTADESVDVLSAHYSGTYSSAILQLKTAGWHVKIADRNPSTDCVILDRSSALFAVSLPPDHQAETRHWVSSSSMIGELQDHFEILWEDKPKHTLIYEDLLLSSIPEQAENIVIASNERWDKIIEHLLAYPADLYALHPHRFEDLIAELLIREGMRVHLTGKSKDGGRDILAWANTTAGNHLYLVECKKYAPQRPVGVSVVRALYGVVAAENVTGGMVVTTSAFTRGAKRFQEAVRNRIWLKDYDSVRTWLLRAAPK